MHMPEAEYKVAIAEVLLRLTCNLFALFDDISTDTEPCVSLSMIAKTLVHSNLQWFALCSNL